MCAANTDQESAFTANSAKIAIRCVSVEPGKSVSPDSLRAAEIREQLDRILADFATSGANRRSRLLRYLVEQALEDRTDALVRELEAREREAARAFREAPPESHAGGDVPF